jgi:hypothetical protein
MAFEPLHDFSDPVLKGHALAPEVLLLPQPLGKPGPLGIRRRLLLANQSKVAGERPREGTDLVPSQRVGLKSPGGMIAAPKPVGDAHDR